MNQFHSPADVFRKVGFLALVGFGVIMLSGPIVAILSVLLSFSLVVVGFALVGLLIWVPLQFVFVGRQAASENIHNLGRGVGHVLGNAGPVAYRLISFPAILVGRLVVGVFHLAGWTLKTTFVTAKFLIEFSVVTLAGVLVGAVSGLLFAPHNQDMVMAVATNAVAGGAIGALTALVMTVRERRSVAQPVKAMS